MLPKDFELDVFPTRATAATTLRERAKTPPPETRKRWVLAWDHFRVEASAYIKAPPCFRESDPNWKKKRDAYRVTYRHQAVLHFLPHFYKTLPLVTGQYEKRVRAAIRILERWKNNLPEGYNRELHKVDTSLLEFSKGDSPPPIMLPMPPSIHKVREHPAPASPRPDGETEQQLHADEPRSPPWSMSEQYPDGFESEDWDILELL